MTKLLNYKWKKEDIINLSIYEKTYYLLEYDKLIDEMEKELIKIRRSSVRLVDKIEMIEKINSKIIYLKKQSQQFIIYMKKHSDQE